MVVDGLTAPLTVVPLLGAISQPILYLLGLTAVFLLAFRGRWADRMISFFLAVLWFCMALTLCLAEILVWRELTWLGALFALQSLLFLVEGVVRKSKDGRRGRLNFEPRASAGPVAGGLFLLYSLILHPLLAAFHIGSFQPVLGLPFHGVLFTFGLLLFLDRDFPRYVLVWPLIWAAIGGLVAFRSVSQDFGLFAALLAGASLALPRRRVVTDVEGNPRRETWYEHAARYHHACGRSVLLLVLVTCFLGFLVSLARNHEGSIPLPPLFRQLEMSATLLSVLVLGLWVSLPAWYNAGFRLLAWETGRGLRMVRRLWDWLTARWGGVILLLGLLVFAAWQIYDSIKDIPVEKAEERDLILAALSLLLLYAIYRARRRIIISEFLNHTGEAAMDSLAKGLASRLHNELANITSLYRTIDEAMPPQSGRVVGVTVGVVDVVESLNDILGPDSSVKLGKLEIPIGLLFRGLSRIVRGPRLTGSLHKEGDGYMVLADLAGGGLSGSWRVSLRDLEPEDQQLGTATVYRMAEQLAYRIITNLGNLGSPRWEAVQHFTRGLRAYRTTQVVKGDASPELRAAEREFIEALSMDRTFSQCHYNLGVIYQSLQLQDSAEAAFRKILSEDPDWAEAYYALATVYYETGQYKKAAIFARKMIEIRPADARAWNLNGLARFVQRDAEAHSRQQLEQDFRGPAWDEIARSFKIAAAVAWRSLCTAALKDSSKPLRKETSLAVRCVNNLAIAKGDAGDGDARRMVLEQAFRLSRRDARAHLLCGESLFEEQKWEEARTELYQSFGDALVIQDHVLRWVYLLGAHGVQWTRTWSVQDREDVLRAYACLLNHIVPPETVILTNPRNVEIEIEKGEYGKNLDSFEVMLKAATKRLPPGPYPYASPLRLVQFLRSLEIGGGPAIPVRSLPSDQQEWAHAQFLIHEARHTLEDNPFQAVQDLLDAIRFLESQDFMRQVEQQGLHSLAAKALLADAMHGGRSDLKEALYHAQKSVSQAPGSAARRWILADVYSAAGDFKEACEEREIALKLGPGREILGDLGTMSRIARDYLLLSGLPERRAPEDRLRRGQDFFQRILLLVESHKAARSAAHCQAHSAAHFWVGRFQCELGNCDEGITHLRIAHSLSFRPIETGLRLGNLYSLKQDFDEARKAFMTSLALVRQKKKKKISQEKMALLALRTDEAPAEFEVELRLSCAMLYAEHGVRPQFALRLCRHAWKNLKSVKGTRKKELRALYHECSGWIRFMNGEVEEGRKELERAALATGERRAYARLARIYEKAGASGILAQKVASQKAAEALRKAQQNGSFSGQGVFDLMLLLQSQAKEASKIPTS